MINLLTGRKIISPDATSISFSVLTQSVKKYLAYGNFSRVNNNTIYQFAKNGTSHLQGQSYAKITFDTANETVALLEDVITSIDPYGLEGGSNSIINNDVFVFTPRSDSTDVTEPPAMLDAGYYKSTDGTTGEAFASFVNIPAIANERKSFYGTPFMVGTDWYVTEADVNLSGDNLWHMRLFKSIDNGANWTYTTMLNTTANLSEQEVIPLGNNRMLTLARKNDSTYGLWQSVSNDNGVTWGTYTESSLTTGLPNTGASNCSMCINYKGTIDVVFMVRGTGNIYLSKDNGIGAIYASPAAWNTPSVLLSIGGLRDPHGYANIINIDDGKNGRLRRNNYLITFTKDNGDDTTDFYYGFGSI